MGVITARQLCDKSVTPLDRPGPSQTCHTTVARLSLFVLRCHPGRSTVLAMTTDRRRDRGALGERIAAEHLEHRGYRVVDRNYRTRSGELDLVVADARAPALLLGKRRVAGGGRRARA